MMGAAPLLRLTGLRKSFALPDGGRFDAVRGVSLTVRAGEIYGIAGRSGAGKSTLLRLVNLLERPDAGTVSVDGQELTALSKRDLRTARQNIGMIFQGFHLLQNATVADNVAFPLRIHGARARAQIAQRVTECLDLVGLLDKAARSSVSPSPARWPAARPCCCATSRHRPSTRKRRGRSCARWRTCASAWA